MKLITAIIQPFILDRMARALLKAPIRGYTVTEVKGSTHESDSPEYLVPRARVEVVVEDEKVDHMNELMSKAAGTHQEGDGIIYISELVHLIDIRTGKRDTEALSI